MFQLVRKRIEQGLYAREAQFNTQSAYLEQHLVQTDRNIKVGVVPVFVESIEALPLPENIRFLFVGRLHRLKGPQTAIEAISRLPDSAKLDIVGSGQMEQELCDKVRAMNLDGRVHFTGHLTGQALKQRYAQASCVIVPSVMPENCPLSVQEAMAYGRPVIASNVGGVAELVQDGVTGFLVPPADPVALSEAMARIYGNRNLAVQFGEAGLSRIAASKFTTAYHLKALEHQYLAAIESFQKA
jgi:glycosyltransferase involved in cell wall biosynthesis